MTPLAMKAMKAALMAGDRESYDLLCQFQWFDVTAIEPMIDTAIDDNRSIERLGDVPAPPISAMAQLPARYAWIEARRSTGRCAWVCTAMDDGAINIRCCTDTRRWPRVIIRPGSDKVLSEKEGWGKYDSDLLAPFIGEQVEAILCIINQPGLVHANMRQCHKGAAREARKRGHAVGDAGLWTVYTIRPGRHGRAYGGDSDAFTRPLHHVRKHYKPRASAKLGRPVWIDDYWRGDADLGIIHKTYVVKPPAVAQAA